MDAKLSIKWHAIARVNSELKEAFETIQMCTIKLNILIGIYFITTHKLSNGG